MKLRTAQEQFRLKAHEDYLTNLHGPPPVNIFRELRLQNDLSLQGLAIQSGLSKNALVRAEQGTYSSPLPSLLGYWVNKRGLNELDLVTAYEDYQYYQRKRNLYYFGTSLRYDVTSAEHPFRQLRHSRISHVDKLPLPVGPDEVSRALCIPVDTIRYWEKKFRLQQSVPAPILSVLLFLGYGQSEVQEFRQNYKLWRARYIELRAV